MAGFIIQIILFGLPFVYLPSIMLAFEPPKVIAFEFLVEILLLLKLWKEKIEFKRFNKIHLYSFAALFLLTIIHLLISHTQLIFLGNIFRFQGVILLWNLLLFSFISSTFNIKSLPKVIYVLLFILLLITTLIIGPNKSHRWIGTIGEPNALASLVIFLLPFTLLLTDKTFKILVYILSIIILILTGSKSGFIAFGIQILFFLLYFRFKFSLKKTFIICLFIMIVSYISPFIEGGGIYENRSQIWTTSALTIIRSPLVGFGFGNTENALKESAEIYKNSMRFQYIDSAHNIFLDWLIQGGIIGFLLLLGILYQTIRLLIKNQQIYLLIALIGLLTTASYNPLNINSLIALWWIIGQSVVSTSHL